MDRKQRKELDKRLDNLIENSMTIEDVKKRVNEEICRYGGISAELLVNELSETAKEMVNHPSHYNMGKYEAIDVIEDWQLNFNLGNTVKYISRAGHKDDIVQDLKKALWYLEREIKRIENTK